MLCLNQFHVFHPVNLTLFSDQSLKICGKQEILLRERKRHTAARVASTCYAALSNPDLVGGYPIQMRPGLDGGGTRGTPHHPDLVGGTPSKPSQGVPLVPP